MQIVINIPKYYYENNIKNDLPIYLPEDNIIAILPKGHGRLGDLDALYSDISNGIKAGNYEEGYEEYGHINNVDDVLETIKYADAIIEANKEADE